MVSTHAICTGKRSLTLASCVPNPTHHGRFFSTFGDASSEDSSSNPSPWKVAIVGSGPSGCYTAKYLLAGVAKLPESSVSIDVIERLPTPYGLVRNGVAPDHPEVKNVQNDFDGLFEEQGIGFYGNVKVGGKNGPDPVLDVVSCDVALDDLRELYDIVVLAYGCESDRELHLPVDVLDQDGRVDSSRVDVESSHIRGILSAREFVNWYNGHPDYEWVTHHVQDALWKETGSKQNIVVVGHGNVALDCARILAKARDTLDPTDLTSRALDILRPPYRENDRSVSVVGRRGHVQAAFTIKEVRELTKLMETDHAQLVLRQNELELGKSTEASNEELKARPRGRIDKLLEGHLSKQQQSNKSEGASTEVNLRFLTNPIRFEATVNKDALVLSSVVCERTQLEGEIPGKQTAVGTGFTEAIPADLCLVSIGYKGESIDATTSECFDVEKGILRNDHGKVISGKDNLAPLYVSGWLKRGPSGIIGTNIGDAKDTVLSILKDLKTAAIPKSRSTLSLKDLLQERHVRFVDWEAYRRIEACESSVTKSHNALGHQKRHPDQPREKLVDRELLLKAAEA